MDRLRDAGKYGWWVFVIVVALAGSVGGILGYRFITGTHRIDRIEQQQRQINAQQRQISELIRRLRTVLTANCALRSDLDERIKSQGVSIRNGERFLRKNPNGAFGFTRQDIEIQLSGQRRALANSVRSRKALRKLKCGKG